MKVKSLWGVTAIIQAVLTVVMFVLLILMMNCDGGAAKYFLWDNGEIVYRNALSEVSTSVSCIALMILLPLVIMIIVGAVSQKAGVVAKVAAIIASIVMSLVIIVTAVNNIFVFNIKDPFYPHTSFYSFDAGGVPVVIAERSWGLGSEVAVYRLTDDGHAQSLGSLSNDEHYLPGGRYELDRKGEMLTISYYKLVRDSDTEENSPKIDTTLEII